ncbi:MAG: dienelactone hydrolase family protein [Alphaproteobacteria bacterium]|nr:dienelactone hydrolase family protein [Alphaproteobacteria bacterium]
MGDTVSLTAADGHRLGAYAATPSGDVKGAVVIAQEIFGVNAHIRAVCDTYAAQGYAAIAPALFDRIERDIELGYEPADVEKGRALKAAASDAGALADIEAALAALPDGPKAVIGYCWGGYIAWRAAQTVEGLAASIGYYGGGIAGHLEDAPKCPTMLHFGNQDAAIPLSDVETVRARYPTVPIHLYEAGHGFNCDLRASYDKESADTALERTLAFLEANFGNS